jgi:hypothetical protein
MMKYVVMVHLFSIEDIILFCSKLDETHTSLTWDKTENDLHF